MELGCDTNVGFPGPDRELEKLIRELLAEDYGTWEDAVTVVPMDKPSRRERQRAPRFLSYRWYVEFYPDETTASIEQAVSTVARLVRGFKLHGYDAVPACDYEDQIAAELS